MNFTRKAKTGSWHNRGLMYEKTGLTDSQNTCNYKQTKFKKDSNSEISAQNIQIILIQKK